MLSSLQLQALVHVCDAGSFDAAARELHVSSSALSQRISALERAVGFPLVNRGRPVTPTAEGSKVLGLARATVLLHSETMAELHPEESNMPRVAIAVNGDSLSTWFQPVVAQIAEERRWLLDLTIDDESHTAELLGAGRVSCAISTAMHTSPGAHVERLGMMQYRAVAATSLFERWGSLDPRELPFIRFNDRDFLQHRFLERIGVEQFPPFHSVPSLHDFLPAIEAGLGWAMLPNVQAVEAVQSGSLVYVGSGGGAGRDVPAPAINLPLYWHRTRGESRTLADLTTMVRAAAAVALQASSA